MNVLVQNLVDTREYFVGEIKPDYHVIYEKFEHNDATYVRNQLQTKKLGTKEVIQILRGQNESSLCRVHSYQIGEEYPSLEAALTKVRETHKELFF